MKPNTVQKIDSCLACGGSDLQPLLDLNDQPLANSYKTSQDASESYYPLAVNLCKSCYHVQLTHLVPPELMFKNYLYVSGTTKTQLDYFDWFANFVLEDLNNKNNISVLDIGCNDGSQLNVFLKLGHKTYGIDPAENLYEISSKNHNVTLGFFDNNYIQNVDVIISQNSFAHNYDPLSFLINCKSILNYNGRIYIQTSQADMILNNEFDTIYHEHISFYNILSMEKLCKRAGLNLIDVVKTPIHGTSYVFVISRDQAQDNRVRNLIGLEKSKGLYDTKTYDQYREKCLSVVTEFNRLMQLAKDEGYRLVGYGAPAKGNTFLNFANNKMLECIIDDNSLKHNTFTPGTSIPIVSPDIIKTLTDEKVLFVPLAWNFFDEIKKRIQAYNLKNYKFIRYFPIVEIVEV